MSAPFLLPLPESAVLPCPVSWWSLQRRRRVVPPPPMCRLVGCYRAAETSVYVMGRDEVVCGFHASLLTETGVAS